MALVDLASLVVAATRDAVYAKLLDIADAVGLSTETWEAGDPTRTLFDAVARIQSAYETGVVEAIRSGFLDLASGTSLTLCAQYVYAVERTPASFAQCTIRLTNTGALPLVVDPDDLVAVEGSSGATYRNSTGGTVAPGGGTLDLTFIAEEAGTGSNAGVGDITALQTPIAKIAVSNTTAAVATDEESDADLRARCRAKLGSLSPNGPADAYHYVATTAALTGNTETTRTKVFADSSTGDVVLFVGGNSGQVTTDARDAVEDAVETWAVPLTVQVTVLRATNLTVPITYTLFVYDSIALTSAEIQTKVSDALLAGFRSRPIGGDSGTIYRDWIIATILQAVAPHGYRLTLASPAADVSVANTSSACEVAVVGTITPTINLVGAP
jgi:phage-related baseplate assembly protein